MLFTNSIFGKDLILTNPSFVPYIKNSSKFIFLKIFEQIIFSVLSVSCIVLINPPFIVYDTNIFFEDI